MDKLDALQEPAKAYLASLSQINRLSSCNEAFAFRRCYNAIMLRELIPPWNVYSAEKQILRSHISREPRFRSISPPLRYTLSNVPISFRTSVEESPSACSRSHVRSIWKRARRNFADQRATWLTPSPGLFPLFLNIKL